MSKRIQLSIALGLMMATGAIAQDGPPPMPPHGGMPMGGGFGGPGGPGMGRFGGGGKVVTGAPYSADVTSQSVETLADGNTISRNTTGHVARDSQGRTYTQETITGGFMAANGPVTVTFISDPVAGVNYVLNSSTKVATKMQKRTPPQDGTARQGRDWKGANGAGTGPDAANTRTTDLGSQNINGVTAQGKSITHTIPAGAMGNAQPIVSTGETWYSPDLQTIVLAKRSDPRMGQSTFSLQNIQRSEPAATLFQVPSDYTVQDGKAAGRGGRGFGGNRAPAPPQ